MIKISLILKAKLLRRFEIEHFYYFIVSSHQLIYPNFLECPFGTYGNRCIKKCNCGHGCDPRTGECLRCPAGRSGVLCEQSCPVGMWGEKCMNHCGCAKNAECDNIDGSCQCYNGFTGEKCNLGIQDYFHTLYIADQLNYLSIKFYWYSVKTG